MDEPGRLFEQIQYDRSSAAGHFQCQPTAPTEVRLGPRDDGAVECEPVGSAIECERGVEVADFRLKVRQVAGGDVGRV